jgi:hypothetical protein
LILLRFRKNSQFESHETQARPLSGLFKGKTFLAIYELNGDTLRICYDLTGKVRLTEFKTRKGEPLFLATYKPAKT